jgi:hypothetical protein
VTELASLYGGHPTQIAHGQHRLQKEMPDIFSASRDKWKRAQEVWPAQLYQQIGQLKVALGWVKKSWTCRFTPTRRSVRQGALGGWLRSTSSDRAHGERAEKLRWMRLPDEPDTQPPYDGVWRMTAGCQSHGDTVHHKRVARLLHTLGVETISPKPRPSQPYPEHWVATYLLRGVPITRGHQPGGQIARLCGYRAGWSTGSRSWIGCAAMRCRGSDQSRWRWGADWRRGSTRLRSCHRPFSSRGTVSESGMYGAPRGGGNPTDKPSYSLVIEAK